MKQRKRIRDLFSTCPISRITWPYSGVCKAVADVTRTGSGRRLVGPPARLPYTNTAKQNDSRGQVICLKPVYIAAEYQPVQSDGIIKGGRKIDCQRKPAWPLFAMDGATRARTRTCLLIPASFDRPVKWSHEPRSSMS